MKVFDIILSVNVTPLIFRNYDIRGIVPVDLNSLISEHIGKAFGTLAHVKYGTRIVVGHDNRSTSQDLKDKLVYGLMSAGCNVCDIGLSLTPIVQFLTFDKRFDAGVMVTASHNPKEFNGFRLIGKKATPIYADAIADVLDVIKSESYKKENGSITYEDLSEVYENYLLQNFNFKNKLKVLVDCGNGTASVLIINLLNKFGFQVSGLYCNLDSDYPHGVPDPENNLFMDALSKEVVEGNFDIGIALDIDSDRFGVVDEKGTVYENDKMLLLFAKSVLKENPSKKVVFDVKSTYLLEEKIKEFGGEPKMIRTGHPYFIEELKNGAILGAEFSGHTFFGDRYLGFDDGIYAALRVLEILDKENKTLSELMNAFPNTNHTSEIKINCLESEKFALVQKVKDTVNSSTLVTRIIDLDGVRAYLNAHTWFLVRASNTNPYVSVRLESATKEGFNDAFEFIADVLPAIKNSSLSIPIHFS